jgi:ribose transport system permease protein
MARLDAAAVVADETYELSSDYRCRMWGISHSGGRGSILGTVFGCLITGIRVNGLVLMEVHGEVQ